MPQIMPKPALPRRYEAAKQAAFDAQTFLDSAGVARKAIDFPKRATIFAQGDAASLDYSLERAKCLGNTVKSGHYLQSGLGDFRHSVIGAECSKMG